VKTGTWDEFAARRGAVPSAPEDDTLADLCARLFSTIDGREFLRRQRELKFGASIDPNIPEAHLRHLEGQRQMLRDIDRLVSEGLERRERKRIAG
jgi:hypothetical protein